MDPNQVLSEEDAKKAWDEEAAALDPVEPAPETQPEPEPEPAPTPEPEPAAPLPAELVERLNRLEKDNADLKNHVRAAEGRVAAFQREREEQKRQAEAAPTSAQVATATANPEKWNQLKEDFPEWAEAMEEYVASRVGQNVQGVSPDQLNKLVEEKTAQIRTETQEAIEYSKLESKHEDWKETINSAGFSEWIKAQPTDVYNLIDSPKATDAVKVLDLYKAAQAAPKTTAADIKNLRRNIISSAVVTKPGESRPSKTIDSMTPEELWNYEARQRTKRNEQQSL